eukprot:gnl/Dysnectes_brevis/1085_a1214_5027.p1 GENE.gnl/Dysnectes_brevis/1085_a1214_5027~~gnl/Dysnectes_brevis/1085_a1214_5027.p1  ORF type:complete len:261 (-),score=37.78 gnl/Dysnectes_brevis/1085_a1214_5027:71-853(-)
MATLRPCDRFLWFPQPSKTYPELIASQFVHNFPIEDVCEDCDVLDAYYILVDPTAPTIIHWHGNGESSATWAKEWLEYATTESINFVFVEFRGYGDSDGVPSLHSATLDAPVVINKVIEYLHTHPGFKDAKAPLYVYGRSMGSASALEAAVRCPELLSGVILDSGITDLSVLLSRTSLPEHEAARDTLRHDQKIRTIAPLPVLWLHATRDQFFPIEAVRAYTTGLTHVTLVEMDTNHNMIWLTDGEEMERRIAEFVRQEF